MIRYIAQIFLLSIILSSCNFLDEKDDYLLMQKTYFTTSQELEASLYPVYNYMFKDDSRLDGVSGRSWGLNCGADDITSLRGLNKQRLLEFDDFQVSTENDDLDKVWKSLYRSIGASNNILVNLDKINNIIMDDDLRSNRLGEVYFLRSLAYFYLVKYWGEVPIITENMSGPKSLLQKTSGIQQVYDFIVEDALKAEAMLPALQTEKGRPNVDAAKTLLSYVYINMAGWPLKKGQEYYAKAALKAKEVIDAKRFSLEENFADLWAFDKRFFENEHIFAFYPDFAANRNYGSFGNKSFRSKEEGGWSEVLVEKHFAEQFPEDNRKESSITTTIKYNKKGKLLSPDKWLNWKDTYCKHPLIAKYRDLGGATWKETTSNAVFPIFRFADVLLLFAEADNLANNGPSKDALNALVLVQTRAYKNTKLESNIAKDGMSKDAFDAVVLQERAWEFAFELKRWNDLVRREKVKDANAFHNTEDYDFNLDVIDQTKYIFPIPAREKLINPNL